MDRNDIDWHGYIPAITTAFNNQNEFDSSMQGELLEWMHQEGMHGVVVAGTTGEWFSMTIDEKRALYKVTGEVLSGKITIIAGCNAFTARETVELAKIAGENKFDGILVTPPPYVKPCAREIYTFYADISAESPLPICVYNWPPGTGVDMDLDLLEQICKLEKVVAVKNSTGSPERFVEVAEALHDRVRIYGAPTNEYGADLITRDLSQGLMGSGAVLGKYQPAFFDEVWAGNLDKALEYGAMDRRVMEDWFDIHYMAKFGSAQAIMKAALNLRGLPGGQPRRPVLPLTEDEISVIRKTLSDLGLL